MKASLIDRGSVERLLLLAGAIRSGIVDALAGLEPATAEQVAGEAKTDVRASVIVLEALAAEGVVERLPGTDSALGPGGNALYRFTTLGRAHLVDEGPELERSGLLHQVNKVRGWLELPDVIRTGEAPARGTVRRDVRSRSLAMGERDPEILDEIVARCLEYVPEARTMIDIGGAVGHVARHFAGRGLRSTLLDQEEVLAVAREFLGADSAGLEMISGDFTVSLPPGPFDLLYYGNVYHIYGPQTNERVTRTAFASTSPGGAIAIHDYTWGRSPRAAMFAVNMLQATEEGGVWSDVQYTDWLTGAGFESIEVVDLKAAESQLILGRRPRVST